MGDEKKEQPSVTIEGLQNESKHPQTAREIGAGSWCVRWTLLLLYKKKGNDLQWRGKPVMGDVPAEGKLDNYTGAAICC